MDNAQYLRFLQHSLEIMRDDLTELIEDVRMRKEWAELEEDEDGNH